MRHPEPPDDVPFVKLIALLLTFAPLAVAERAVASRFVQTQSATAPGPAFEVASIKPNKSGERAGGMRLLPGGRFEVVNMPLAQLIRTAYQLEDFQLSGGPGWLNSDHYDIVARAQDNPSPPQTMVMVRTLLEERFKLVTHRVTRDLPVYALVIARNDGALGPRFRKAVIEECPPRAGAVGSAAGAVPDFRNPPCGLVLFGPGPSGRGATGRTIPIAEFVKRLAPIVSRPIIDRTKLDGRFDLDLDFTPDLPPPADSIGNQPSADIGPSIFTALQEQLGLRLESTRGAVEVLVVDSVEKPTPD
jgi:uncharacterized protein (TIGR03435 family)